MRGKSFLALAALAIVAIMISVYAGYNLGADMAERDNRLEQQ